MGYRELLRRADAHPGIELTDPDGRYAYIPFDAARLQLDGDRTRGPWTSQQPRRRCALERARAAINHRKQRRRDR